MATFFMAGCSGEEQALSYFDLIFGSVQELVDLDSTMQERLEEHLVSEEDTNLVSLPATELSFDSLELAYDELKDFVQSRIEIGVDIQVYKDEFALKQAYIRLLDIYDEELNVHFPKIYRLMQLNVINDEEMLLFNTLLHESQERLDNALDEFYNFANDYAARHNIEIED
jgi:hypothetical protein